MPRGLCPRTRAGARIPVERPEIDAPEEKNCPLGSTGRGSPSEARTILTVAALPTGSFVPLTTAPFIRSLSISSWGTSVFTPQTR
jgi:hypothetical protein